MIAGDLETDFILIRILNIYWTFKVDARTLRTKVLYLSAPFDTTVKVREMFTEKVSNNS